MRDDTTNNQEPAQPPPCNHNVYRDGVPIFGTHTIRSSNIERWVQRIAALSGQPVDWHFSGGRAIVLACGDVDAARRALVALLPEHDRLFREASSMHEDDATAYLASMRTYAGLDGVVPAEIGASGVEECEKYMVRL